MHLLRRFLIITFLACTVISCAPPTGSLYDNDSNKNKSPGSVDSDSFFIVPKRTYYIVNDEFNRLEDLSVFAGFKAIPTSEVEISIIEDPDSPKDPVPVPHDYPNEFYIFKKPRRNRVVVSYNNMTAHYDVEVSDPYDLSNDDDDDDGTGGIIIIWP